MPRKPCNGSWTWSSKVLIFVIAMQTTFSLKRNEHRHLRMVLAKLDKFEFVLNIFKCSFDQQEVRYLGYTLNKYSIRPSTDRIQVIRDYPKPGTVDKLRKFLGAAARVQAQLIEIKDQSSRQKIRRQHSRTAKMYLKNQFNLHTLEPTCP